MHKSFLARSMHKWLGLVVGLQVLIWLGSGLYMVVVDLDFIHGDPLVKNTQQTIAVPAAAQVSISGLHQRYPDATAIGLRAVMGNTFFTVTTKETRYLVDPQNGAVVSPLKEKTIREIATFYYKGNAPVLNIELLTDNPPREIGQRPLPLWRVDFDDQFNTSFYIDPYSGTLSTRRHQYWRIFDFLFMLHIMDYDERADVHNLLLKIAQFTGVVFAITGFWLLFYSFKKRRKAVIK